MVSLKLETSRSRNDPKPLPISQRILGFEKKSPKPSYHTTENFIQLNDPTPSDSKIPSVSLLLRRQRNSKLNGYCQNEHSSSKNVVNFSKFADNIESTIPHQDFNRSNSETLLKETAFKSSNLPENYPALKELGKSDCQKIITSGIPHPYRKADQFNVTKKLVISKSEALKNSPSENTHPRSINYRKGSKSNLDSAEVNVINPVSSLSSSYGIYKPPINRPTRYPRPSYSRNNSKDIPIYDSKNIPVDLTALKNVPGSKTEIARYEIIKLDKVEKNQLCNGNNEAPIINQSSKISINNKRLSSPIQFLTNTRGKGRRNFEPQNMNFSELSSSSDAACSNDRNRYSNSETNFIQSNTLKEFSQKDSLLINGKSPLISKPQCAISAIKDGKNDDEFRATISNATSPPIKITSESIVVKKQSNKDKYNSTQLKSIEKVELCDVKYPILNSPQCYTSVHSSESLKLHKRSTPINLQPRSRRSLDDVLSYSRDIGDLDSDEKLVNNQSNSTIPPTLGKINLINSPLNSNIQKDSLPDIPEFYCETTSKLGKYFQKNEDVNNFECVNEGPISLAQRDIQAWIENIIENQDSISASYLISSKILEKTSHAIAQRHALEREETQKFLIDNNRYFSQILKENNSLRRKFMVKQICNEPIISEICQFHVINNGTLLNPRETRSQSFPELSSNFWTSNYPETDLHASDQGCSIKRNRQDKAHTTTQLNVLNRDYQGHSTPHSTAFVCPSPPPNLPEVSLKYQIPAPPLDIPNCQMDKSESSSTTAPKFIETCKRSKFTKKAKMMKPLHWKRLLIQNRKHKCEIVWKGLPKVKLLQSEIVNFEELFENHTSRKPNRSGAKDVILALKPKEILSPDISKQLGIILRKIDSLHISMADIENMLYSGDIKQTNLTSSLLESLSKLVTDEHIQDISDFVKNNPKVELTKESKTVLFFSDVPHVNLRLRHILNMQNFEEDIQNIDRNLNIIINCCKIFRDSHEMRTLLAIILLLGNHMNQAYDSFKDATGFSLELLPRLKETKSKDNSRTFLEFVSYIYLQKIDPNIFKGSPIKILPFPDTGDLLVASTTTLQELHESLNMLGKQITKIREDTMHLIFEGDDNSKSKLFVEQVENFFQIAERKITEKSELWKIGLKSFQELTFYFYGEFRDVSDNTDTTQFFGIWSEFATTFKEAIVKEHKNITILRRNTSIQANTIIAPISPAGLKSKLKNRKGRTKTFILQTSVN